MTQQTNPELQLATEFVQFTNRNVFLTGRAGTGKTTFLQQLKKNSPKRMVVVAPTGVAAINAGGVTIHSFFQMPFGPFIPGAKRIDDESSMNGKPIFKLSREKINILKSIDLLVIDEVSMVRADLLDGIDEVLRRYKVRSKPFGGVQLLMIGDLNQLAPVVKDEEWNMLRNYYTTPFFFGSRALQQTDYISIELKHIFRQSDRNFIELLNKVRENALDDETLNLLNSRYVPNYAVSAPDGFITLTTHNYQALAINEKKLNALQEKITLFKAEVKGDFPEYMYPTEFELALKVGAQVMFVKNHSSPEKLYYNGKIGKIIDIDEDIITVECPDDPSPIEVGKEEWQNCKYSLNEATLEVEESVIGSFVQHPLKLAWAITIHKSQGLTFEKAIIDAKSAFAFGQVYVALSRCKTFEGLFLNSKIGESSIKTDSSIRTFTREIEENQPSKQTLTDSKLAYEQMLVFELFDFSYLANGLKFIRKQANENIASIEGSFIEKLEGILSLFNMVIFDVNEKFKFQLQQLFSTKQGIESNAVLIERISKASQYFIDKFETILEQPIKGLSIESDNRTVKKTLSESIKRITSEIAIKQVCLTEAAKGFSVKGYLNAKVRGSIEPAHFKSERKPKSELSYGTETGALYGILKQWRNSKADELNVSDYLVVPFKTLKQISEVQPSNKTELKRIKGLGKKKFEQFGSEILEIVREYRADKGLEISAEIDEPELETKAKPPKVNSREQSFQLFKEGKSVAEIARIRNFSTQTIEGHLLPYIVSGDIDIEKLVSHSKIKVISNYVETAATTLLGDAKAALGDDYSYSEIKFVLAWLKRSK